MSLPRRVVCPERSQRETNVPLSGTAYFREELLLFASERRRIPHTDNTRSLSALRPFYGNQMENKNAGPKCAPARVYLRFALNRYSTPTEIAKFTSVEVALSP